VIKRPHPVRARLRSLLLLGLFGMGVLLTTAALATAELGPALRVGAIALSVIVNVGLFVLAFRALTARNVSVRDVQPGAVMAAVAWQVLQSVGTAYVGYHLRGSSQVYGLFGIVLGLFAWIYLEAVIIVLAAELNVVLRERLWPRALLAAFVEDVDLTHADRRSYESYASAQQYRAAESIDVKFEPPQKEQDDTSPS
jgi:membrane protein